LRPPPWVYRRLQQRALSIADPSNMVSFPETNTYGSILTGAAVRWRCCCWTTRWASRAMEPAASARGRPVVTKTVTKQRSWSVCASNCYAGETTANAVISPGVPEEGLEPSYGIRLKPSIRGERRPLKAITVSRPLRHQLPCTVRKGTPGFGIRNCLKSLMSGPISSPLGGSLPRRGVPRRSRAAAHSPCSAYGSGPSTQNFAPLPSASVVP
jgi:hypothetical protein